MLLVIARTGNALIQKKEKKENYWHIIDFVSQQSGEFLNFLLIKSFMYMRNNKGPKMEPCGMPYLVF